MSPSNAPPWRWDPYRALLWAQLAAVVMIGAVIVALPGGVLPGEHAAGPTLAIAGWIAAAGVFGLLGYVCLFYAFAHGRLTVAVPIMSSWAVLSAALSIAFLGERLGAWQVAGGAAVVAGAVVVSRYAHSDPKAGGAHATGGSPRVADGVLGGGLGLRGAHSGDDPTDARLRRAGGDCRRVPRRCRRRPSLRARAGG